MLTYFSILMGHCNVNPQKYKFQGVYDLISYFIIFSPKKAWVSPHKLGTVEKTITQHFIYLALFFIFFIIFLVTVNSQKY